MLAQALEEARLGQRAVAPLLALDWASWSRRSTKAKSARINSRSISRHRARDRACLPRARSADRGSSARRAGGHRRRGGATGTGCPALLPWRPAHQPGDVHELHGRWHGPRLPGELRQGIQSRIGNRYHAQVRLDVQKGKFDTRAPAWLSALNTVDCLHSAGRRDELEHKDSQLLVPWEERGFLPP